MDIGFLFGVLIVYLLIKFSMGKFKLHWFDGIVAIFIYPLSIILGGIVLICITINFITRKDKLNEKV